MQLIRFHVPVGYYVPVPDGYKIDSHHTLRLSAFGFGRSVRIRTTYYQLDPQNSDMPLPAYSAIEKLSRRLGLIEDSKPAQGGGSDNFTGEYRTVIDVITEAEMPQTHDPALDPRRWPHLSDPIMLALEQLRRQNVAISNLTESYYPPITYETMPSIVVVHRAVATNYIDPAEPHSWVVPDSAEWGATETIQLNHMESFRNVRDQEMEARVEADLVSELEVHADGNPFLRYRQLTIQAKALLRRGQYGDSVVVFNTAMESFQRLLIAFILWEEAWTAGRDRLSAVDPDSMSDPMPGIEIQKTYKAASGKKKIREFLASRLGGNWSSKDSPWEEWIADSSSLRNRVVHIGHAPDYAAIRAAQSAHDQLISFVADRLVNNFSSYPRIVVKLVGEQSMRDRAMWTSKVRTFFEVVPDQEASWDRLFSEWHESLTLSE